MAADRIKIGRPMFFESVAAARQVDDPLSRRELVARSSATKVNFGVLFARASACRPQKCFLPLTNCTCLRNEFFRGALRTPSTILGLTKERFLAVNARNLRLWWPFAIIVFCLRVNSNPFSRIFRGFVMVPIFNSRAMQNSILF